MSVSTVYILYLAGSNSTSGDVLGDRVRFQTVPERLEPAEKPAVLTVEALRTAAMNASCPAWAAGIANNSLEPSWPKRGNKATDLM
jgi:hypothetical protein